MNIELVKEEHESWDKSTIEDRCKKISSYLFDKCDF